MRQEDPLFAKLGIEPLETLDITATTSFSSLLEAMSKSSFSGRALGNALVVLREMKADKECTIVMTISGAITAGQMGKIVCDMIQNSFAHIIVTTGAVLVHDISLALGGKHYKSQVGLTDSTLVRNGINRIFDTLEPEDNLIRVDEFVVDALLGSSLPAPTSSCEINRVLGKALSVNSNRLSILSAAYLADVPVYVPAFTDSGLGLAASGYAITQSRKSQGATTREALASPPFPFNPFLDLNSYALRILDAEALGIFSVGGGVPRNWAQQVSSYIDILNYYQQSTERQPRFKYGIRICPEPDHWGGLSGSTYSEGVSWGKFVPEADGGRYAEVLCDATIALPLLIRAALE